MSLLIYQRKFLAAKDEVSLEIAMEIVTDRLTEFINPSEEDYPPDFPADDSSLEKNSFNDDD